MIYNGKTYYHVFTAGNYTQANITEEDLREIARNYDPVNFHEAPVWLGHPDDVNHSGNTEPEALAWIDSVIAVGNKLYVSFAYVSDKMKQLIDTQAFKRVSVEIVKYDTDDARQLIYLYAVGLTNRPAVKGLEPIAFTGHKFRNDPVQKFLYHEKFINHNSNQMNQYLIKVAELFGLNTANFTTESSLQEAITLKFNDLKATISPVPPAPAPAPAVNAEVADLQKKLETLQEERVSELVETAVAEFKILPAQKAEFIALGKVSYNVLKSTIANMTVHKDLTDKVIKPVGAEKTIDLSAAKFKKDGKSITYTDFLALSSKEQANFTAEEIAELRKTW